MFRGHFGSRCGRISRIGRRCPRTERSALPVRQLRRRIIDHWTWSWYINFVLLGEVRLLPAAMYSERIQPLQTLVGVCLDSELFEFGSIRSLGLGLLDIQLLLSLRDLSQRGALKSPAVVNGLECMKLPSLIFPHGTQSWSLSRGQQLVYAKRLHACPWLAVDLLRRPAFS